MQFACQRRRQVEAEAVDVHLEHPVAQRVHDELQHVGMTRVERVAGAGVVHVVAAVVVDQAVVRGVVDAAQRQRRTQVVALGGVVVDHVEDHLDAGRVQVAHHRLELEHLLAALAAGGVRVVRGEEADRVVAPVVRQVTLGQVVVLDELVNRHELDRGDAQMLEVVDRHGMRERRIRTANGWGQRRMAGREPLDVELIDDRLVERGARRPVA